MRISRLRAVRARFQACAQAGWSVRERHRLRRTALSRLVHMLPSSRNSAMTWACTYPQSPAFLSDCRDSVSTFIGGMVFRFYYEYS